MGHLLLVLFIILAVLGLVLGILGLVLGRKMWETEKINGTFIYSSKSDSGSEARDAGGRKILHREIGREKLKGVRGRMSFAYRIPEFYRGIAGGDKTVRRHALIVFGFFSMAVFTFFAIGTGLILSGDDNGWIFILVTAAIVLFLITSHIKEYRSSRKKS